MFLPTPREGVASPITHYLARKGLMPPIVVGGVGGSGTRLVVQMLMEIRVFMGSVRNASEDAMPFVPVYDSHINTYLSGVVSYTGLTASLVQALDSHFGSGSSDSICNWGWKNPRSIYILPLLDELFTGMRFIHVVRDGVAMATSENQAQLQKHGAWVIPENFQGLPQIERALLLWSIVNNVAANYGKKMGSRYILIRYEDICTDPVKATMSLASALGIEQPPNLNIPVHPIRTRYVKLTSEIVGATEKIASAALQRFGYPC